MKIKILQQNLKTSLNFLQKVIPSKPQLPILSSIYFYLNQGKLTLAATDLYLGVRTSNSVSSDKNLEIVVPGDTFKDMIYSFSPGELVLEKKDGALLVNSNQSQVKIPVQSAQDYPDFPEVEGDEYRLNKETMDRINQLVTFAASSDQARPVLTAILLNFTQQGLEVVATDGFRLSWLELPEIKVEEPKALLVPVKAFSEVFRIMSQAEAEEAVLQVAEELKQIKFSVKESEIFIRLIEGDYPPYQKIMPAEFETEIQIDGEELRQELKRAHIMAKEASNIVRLEIADGQMGIESSAASVGKYQGKIEIKNKKQAENSIAFNVNYLLDFLNSVKPETIHFKMNESLKPAQFQVDDITDFKYVVMPFRVNE